VGRRCFPLADVLCLPYLDKKTGYNRSIIVICKKCERNLQDADNYCSHCGTKVEDNLDETSEQEAIPLPDVLTQLTEDNNILLSLKKEDDARKMEEDFHKNAWKF
jgi:predicted amidophosphoribosyltransferase